MALDAAGTAGSRVVPRLDEFSLIRAVQNGDQDAFEQLVRAYDHSVLRLAVNLFGRRKTRRMSIRKRF